jgi:hypothetical protein
LESDDLNLGLGSKITSLLIVPGIMQAAELSTVCGEKYGEDPIYE